MADDGGFLVVWESFTQDGDQAGIAARLYDAAGVPLGTDFVLNTYTTGNQQQASVAALAAGGFAVTWESPQDGDGYGVVARLDLRLHAGLRADQRRLPLVTMRLHVLSARDLDGLVPMADAADAIFRNRADTKHLQEPTRLLELPRVIDDADDAG